MKSVTEGIRRILLLSFFLFLAGCASSRSRPDVVFQNAPINALLAGCYSGTMSVRDLGNHGDFGIGTLDALDGELIILDHVFYQVKPDGKAYLLKDKDTSPFATVIFFKPEQALLGEGRMNYQELERFLDQKLLSENLIYAIKITGRFPSLKVRSAARQNPPFPILTDAIREQKVFELRGQEGTLVGFRFPPYAGGINVPGYHFHFLSKDKGLGGHVLDLQGEGLRIQVDESRGLSMRLPANEEFLKADLKINSAEAVAKVEK
ncbi:MAG: acetolactate decarboxylase [Candidatus Omnitrophota bacterium]